MAAEHLPDLKFISEFSIEKMMTFLKKETSFQGMSDEDIRRIWYILCKLLYLFNSKTPHSTRDAFTKQTKSWVI